MPVSIYKTNITSKVKIKKVKPLLDALLHNEKWNFDLDDCDKILRIESSKNINNSIVAALHHAGFKCEELF